MLRNFLSCFAWDIFHGFLICDPDRSQKVIDGPERHRIISGLLLPSPPGPPRGHGP